jgi:uncharacterized NAD(P)/FAD-binding protein YdhS
MSDRSGTQPTTSKPIAIIGGGFAGTALLIHTLLRIADDTNLSAPVEILLAERRAEQLHRGLAYNHISAYPHHNLNTGAASTVLFEGGFAPPGLPSFPDYALERAEKDATLKNVLTDPPRWLFGEYLEHLVELAKKKAGAKAKVTTINDDVTGLAETPTGVRLSFAGGATEAGHVVLATGFQDTLAPKFARAAEKSAHFLTTPYSCHANTFFDKLATANKPQVLIIGTGLTALDCACRLLDSKFDGHITMISRHALLHGAYAPTPQEEYLETGLRGEPRPEKSLPFTAKPPGFAAAKTGEELAAAAAQEYRELAKQGYTSEEILGYWERFAPALAAQIPHDELAPLLSAHDGLITARRVGVTPAIGEKIRKAVAENRIEIKAGSICGVEDTGTGILCTYTPLGAAGPKTETFDYCLSAMGNTVGYDPATTELRHPLWKQLMTEGLAAPHWTKVGIAVNEDFALLGKDGTPSAHISCIGVPVAGHMMVTAYPYPEKPGAGGRLGPAAMNQAGITGGVLAFLSANYDKLTGDFHRPPAAPLRDARRPDKPRPHAP